jgi:uncharacterized protein YkwD
MASGAVIAPTRVVAEVFLRVPALLAALAMWACSSSMSPEAPTAVDPPAVSAPSSIASSIVDLTNAERGRAGLAEFRSNARLMQAAQIQADQMARIGRLDHVLTEATYPRPEDRLAAVSYQWRAYAENVAYNQRGAAEVVNSWMQSAGHRANILNASLMEIGVGYARDASGRPYYVQVFGRPMAAKRS